MDSQKLDAIQNSRWGDITRKTTGKHSSALIFGVHSGRVRKEQPLVKLVKSMKNCCTQDIVSDLLGAPWNVIETFDSIDDKWNCWKSIFQSILDRHVPMKKVRVKRSSLPWITAEVLKVNRARNYFRKKHRRTGNENDWECYR